MKIRTTTKLLAKSALYALLSLIFTGIYYGEFGVVVGVYFFLALHFFYTFEKERHWEAMEHRGLDELLKGLEDDEC